MASAEQKAPFISWGFSGSKAESEKENKDDGPKTTDGSDHQVTHRPPPSLRRYPKGCPPLRTRWFYAVDVPKRKPFGLEQPPKEKAKPQPPPKKLVPFSLSDSQAIEAAFQNQYDRQESSESPQQPSSPSRKDIRSSRVPVNEDYLFDVDIEKRELEPVYWEGPIYDVRRGSWFYPESPPRPCDENLANQLEEGYLKLKPWEFASQPPPRSASQSRLRPTSLAFDKSTIESALSVPSTPKQVAADARPARAEAPTYRLFGAYMNSTATYQDATTAYVSTDDFYSRMSTSVYQRFGSVGGTKVVRGYHEPGKPDSKVDGKTADEIIVDKSKRRSAPPGSLSTPSTPERADSKKTDELPDVPNMPKKTALERQLSSLAAGEAEEDADEIAEEARREEEEEMEGYRELDGEDQNRQIDHLVLVTHGIGQRLGLRLDSINFVHDVNTMRKAIKTVYASAPDLQALNSQLNEMPKNSRIQVLPVCWRQKLDFPKQSLRNNRKELDLADVDAIDEDEYPSLQDITVDGVPAVRNLITDLAMDVLLYQSAYREHIATIVQQECNRIYKLFKERNPEFSGRVSLVGHSLGSAVLFDILCRQKDNSAKSSTAMRHPLSKVSGNRSRSDTIHEKAKLALDFECENFFCLGSPIALFQMLKGRTIAGRRNDVLPPLASPFESDSTMDDPFQSMSSTSGTHGLDSKTANLLPIAVSSPKCQDLYNIFHPTDPISYRIEPLISPAMASMKPQPLPYTKKGLLSAPGIANIGARVGQSVGSMWSNFTSGVASSLLNRSLGLTGEEQALAQDGKSQSPARPELQAGPQVSSSTKAGQLSSMAPPPLPPAAAAAVASANAVNLVADEKKQQELADQANSSTNPAHLPTLIDSDLETLYAGFQKRRLSKGAKDNTNNPPTSTSNPSSRPATPPPDHDGASISSEFEEAEERAKKLKREDAKVRALNSNGRVDYSIQEGVFDISLLASIASHLSYWSDEDVMHFLVSQMLSKGMPPPPPANNGQGGRE